MHHQLYMSKETNLEYGHFIAKRVCKFVCEDLNKFAINNLIYNYEFNIVESSNHICVTMSRYMPINDDWLEYGRIISINTRTLYLSSGYVNPSLYSLYTKDVMNTFINDMYITLIMIDTHT